MQIVGVMLVHNEDAFVERALRNAAGFCDAFHVADHMSTDATWDIVRAVAADLDHVDCVRVRSTGDSHALVEGYAGSDTWVFGIDGDELYDRAGLARFREDLLDGAHREHFSLKGNVLHVTELDMRLESRQRLSRATVALGDEALQLRGDRLLDEVLPPVHARRRDRVPSGLRARVDRRPLRRPRVGGELAPLPPHVFPPPLQCRAGRRGRARAAKPDRPRREAAVRVSTALLDRVRRPH